MAAELVNEKMIERVPTDDVNTVEDSPMSATANNEITGHFDVSDGFNMMQPYWERFRTQIELKAKKLQEQNDESMKMKQEEVDSLLQQLKTTARDYEKKIKTMQEEFKEHLDQIKETHKAKIISLKMRVKKTLNEEEEEESESDNWEIGREKIKEVDGEAPGSSKDELAERKFARGKSSTVINSCIVQVQIGIADEHGAGTNIASKFEGDVTAEGDIFAGCQYAVKSSGEGDATGVSQLLESFGGEAQLPAEPSRSNISEVDVKLDGASVIGCQDVKIQNTSLKINIGRGGKDGDEESDDDDIDFENLQEKELRNRLKQWQKRSKMEDASAFKGPNDRIIELVFADKKEEYFDYLMQDVLPKLEKSQLAEISTYLKAYSTIDLSQKIYNDRYMQVFIYCSPRTQFESLVMKGSHVKSKDLRNFVKFLDSRQRPTHIKRIDLSDCKFDHTAFIELECLFSYATHINLSGITESTVVYQNKEVTFSSEHAMQIARSIERQEQKVCVNLSRCAFNNQITSAFKPMMSKLKMLTLRYCAIDIPAMAVLVEAVCQSKQLRILDLCETKIEPQSFGYLSKCLHILRCLFLSGVMLREEGLRLLLEGLPLVKDGGMECLDVSFNPINREIITQLTETVQNKIKTVVFSKEQIQLTQHKERMKKVKRDEAAVVSITANQMISSENDAETTAADEGIVDPATCNQYSTIQVHANTEIFQQQNPPEGNVIEADNDFAFWVMTATKEEIASGSKSYLESISHEEITRRTLRNTWFQCFQCRKNVAFVGDKLDLSESKHFLRDCKFFGWYQNSNYILLTRAEDDRQEQISNDDSSSFSKMKGNIGMPYQGEVKHYCNMPCSVNGMNMRTYTCTSCKEPLGLHYYREEHVPNQLEGLWCLLQETPGSLLVGATTKFAKGVHAKKSVFGKSIRDASHSLIKRKSFQVHPEEQ